jgi:arylsulfatase
MRQLFLAIVAIFLAHLLVPAAYALTAANTLDRTILPPPAPQFGGTIGNTYKDSVPDWKPALPLNAPEGAPNILLIVLDDVGYGQLGAYGGPIATPHIDKLAASGLQYVDFHTTALCSPSRGALLTGRNHHSIGLAAITEAATGYPGNYGSIPKSAATIAEVLKQNGYNTFALGKWHLAPYTTYTAAGPFDRWPLGMGFERYYGFIGGETDQWAPLLVQDNQFIDTPRRDGYHLSTDLVDKTIAYIRDQQQANTGRPCFAYLAFGAAHAPLHAPQEFITKYKGRFDQGWDKVREETYERQKQMGVISPDTVLPPPNPGMQAWTDLTENQKKVYTRLQEVFASFLEHTDQQIGRLVAVLDGMGLRDNTLIVLLSDNGASQEGLRDGTANTDRFRNYFSDTVDEMLKVIDKLGGPETDPHYPMGWSMAGNAPLKRWKQDVHHGGNTDPLIISWPARIKDAGTKRRQYHHKDKKLHYSHNYLKLQEYAVSSSQQVTAGTHKLSVHFVPKEKSLKPDFFTGDVTLFVDGAQVGALQDIKMAGQYSAITGYGLQIGRNLYMPVSREYELPFRFTGQLEKVTIEVNKDKQ